MESSSRAGRKPWIPPNLKEIEALAARGLTLNQIADALGISDDTLARKRRQLADFADALQKGKATGIAQVANRLFEAAMAGDTTAMIFFLKAQGGWRDRHEIDLNVSGEVQVHPWRNEALELARHMTREERQTILEIEQRARERIKAIEPLAIETTAKPA